MTSRFDGLPDFLLRRLEENEFVKGKTHHPNNIQLSINVKLHYNKIIIWPAVSMSVSVCRIFEILNSSTHTHTQTYIYAGEENKREKTVSMRSTQYFMVNLSTIYNQFMGKTIHRVKLVCNWHILSGKHFKSKCTSRAKSICLCRCARVWYMLPTGKRSTT